METKSTVINNALCELYSAKSICNALLVALENVDGGYKLSNEDLMASLQVISNKLQESTDNIFDTQ
jgi:hypothetical protein